MSKGVKYICPIFDGSGYAEASRNYVLALHKAGYPVTVQPHCFERNPPKIANDENMRIINSLVNKNIDYDKVVVHLTPDLLPVHKSENQGKKIISYTVWETSKLHPHWVRCIEQSADEVWLPCDWNIDSFRDSGVTKPLYKVPHGISEDFYAGVDKASFNFSNLRENGTYIFYSIMQWNARKNPEALLRAYFNAFTSRDNVRLVLKAYTGMRNDDNEFIRSIVSAIKKDMGPLDFPKVSLITDLMSSEQMKAMHLDGDCYVALPHAEGWGLCTFEAGLAGNPVISTGESGSCEFLTRENSFMVPATPSYVGGMSSFNPWYLGNQTWFNPNEIEASEAMRYAYANKEASKAKGQKLSKNIKDKFGWEKVSKIMIERLNNA